MICITYCSYSTVVECIHACVSVHILYNQAVAREPADERTSDGGWVECKGRYRAK